MAARVSPLDIIARRLFAGPPSLRWIFDLFDNAEYMSEFVRLVREFLPDKEAEIMAYPTNDKIGFFFRYFSERYFPLDDDGIQMVFEEGEGNLLAEFIGRIPAAPNGMSFDDYADFQSMSAGFVLLLGLISSPYETPEEMHCRGCIPRTSPETHGERVPILEVVKGLVGPDLVKVIPVRGWTPQQLHKIFDKTKHFAVAKFADIVHHDTGEWWHDTTYEDWDPLEWSREVVEALQVDYVKAQAIDAHVHKLVEWLEKDQRIHFAELLRTLVGPELVPVTLAEVFDKEEEYGQETRQRIRIRV